MDLALFGLDGTDSMWKILYNCQINTALDAALHNTVRRAVQSCADLKSSAAAAWGEKTDYYKAPHSGIEVFK